MTHNNGEPPFCIICNEPFIVKHIRAKYFNAKTIKELFNDSSNDKSTIFLKEITLFNKL